MRVEEIRRIKIQLAQIKNARDALAKVTVTPVMDGMIAAYEDAISILEQMDNEEDACLEEKRKLAEETGGFPGEGTPRA